MGLTAASLHVIMVMPPTNLEAMTSNGLPLRLVLKVIMRSLMLHSRLSNDQDGDVV